MKESAVPYEADIDMQLNLSNVDLLIPFHRIDTYLVESVASAQASKGINVRVIAINDSEQEVNKEKLGLRAGDLLINSEFKGKLGALSAGFAVCESEFVAFLDSDDLQEETRLKHQVDLMLKTGADVSSCNLIKFVGSSTKHQPKSISVRTPIFVKPELILVFGAHGADSSLVIRKQTLNKYKELHNQLPDRLSDYPWLLSMLLGGEKYVHSEEGVYFYRVHKKQLSRNSSLHDLWPEIFTIWNQFMRENVEIQKPISANLGLLIAFPSSLSKISKEELRSLREIKQNLKNYHLVNDIFNKLRLEVFIGIREFIGRRGRTIKTVWIGPLLFFRFFGSLATGNKARRNDR
jgi:glycosyltransferase involved in cell wall biosynthesis